jgi:peptidoglycan/xylan/chitin deacetylase (PgdA/CDA1 family)
MPAQVRDKLLKTARRIRNTFVSRIAILLYHRIADTESDPYDIVVSPTHFEQHLQVARSLGRIMRLQELVQALQGGKLPHRAIVITFDDGYADNLYQAKPLLEKYDAPATVFMTTGSVGREREFWWDELEQILLQPNSLPRSLRLEVAGRPPLECDLGDAAAYTPENYRRHMGWSMNGSGDPTPRHLAFRALHRFIRSLGDGERRQAMDRLLSWARMTPTVRPTHRAMDQNEVVELARGGTLEVGAHTVNHPALSAQPIDVQRDEIRTSRIDLERRLGSPVKSFAYPYGLYTDQTVQAVREAGFESACSCIAKAVRRGSDLMQLPRLEPQDWDASQFQRQMREWL